MGHIPPQEGDTHYADGKTFRLLTDAERRLLAEHAPAPDGGLALDAGRGTGELARHLAATGYRVDAVDIASAALARAEAGQTGPAAVTHRLSGSEHGDPDDLPHPAYDLIVFRLSRAFVRDRTRVLNRLRERLRPNGTLCVVTPVAGAVPDGKRDIALDEDELDLLRTGWRVAERHDADGLAFLVLRDPLPTRVACADKGRPAPHAPTGAGVVVTDAKGRSCWAGRREASGSCPAARTTPARTSSTRPCANWRRRPA
ncbi:class I SAM-dependent methyltransferase [Streptomyces echinoruber]|uniref:class I SAM-dependent methyltransferase n=1 Tax=Streptomyces echinoruber TaxID=68898 RepID=UPI001E381ACD|nr:methyltransferase [Streptomyces echinoruber]